MDQLSERATAERVVARLRTFATALPDDERRALAVILAPGVARLYEFLDADEIDDVEGFELERPSLVHELAYALRAAELDFAGTWRSDTL